MLGDILDRVIAYCDTEETKRLLDERVVAPLFRFLWERYSHQFYIVRNAFLFITILLLAQMVLLVLVYRTISRLHVKPPI